MNIIKQLLAKNLKKALKYLDSPRDEMFRICGDIHILGTNISTGKIIYDKIQKNSLTTLSKSTVMRLIAQQQSNWIGAFDPSLLSISKMRFSNIENLPVANSMKLFYYDLSEPSMREITGDFPAGDGSAGIGATKPGEAIAEIGTPTNLLQYNINDPLIITNEDIKILKLTNQRPPSHGSLEIKLYNDATLIETIIFSNDPYVRFQTGNKPSAIISEGANGVSTDLPDTQTKLFYDFSPGDEGWKFLWEHKNPYDTYNLIDIKYNIGKNNIINTIIPKTGYNIGSGTTIVTRYAGFTEGDAYNINNVEYRNAETNFIDDSKVLLTISMPGDYGNGVGLLEGQKISYYYAFLFTANDDLFSVIKLNTPFDKDSNTSYQITWIISAPE